MCTFSPQPAVGQITRFLGNVLFFASGNCTLSPQQARSKITPFLRNVRFFAAKYSDFIHLKMLKNRILQEASKQQQAKSNHSFGMCTFSPQHAVGKITPFLRNVHFFASGNCTFSPQHATICATGAAFNAQLRALLVKITPGRSLRTAPSQYIRKGRSLKTAPSLLPCEYHTIPRALPLSKINIFFI